MNGTRIGRRLEGVVLRTALVSALAWIAPVAAAQRTWIVDDANGPGTDFTDLGPALFAASSGDTILLRPRSTGGYYLGFYGWLQKSLHVIGLGPALVPVGGSIAFASPYPDPIVLSNLEVTYGLPAFQDCVGPVICHRLQATATPGNGVQLIERVGRVVLADCSWTRAQGMALYALDTPLYLQNCRFEDLRSWYSLGLQTGAVHALDCDVWLMGTELRGGVPWFSNPNDIVYEYGLLLGRSNYGAPPRRAYVGPGSRVVGAPWGRPAPWCPQFPNQYSIWIAGGFGDPNPDYLFYDPLADFVGCRQTWGNEMVHEFPMVLPGDALRGQRQDIRLWGPTGSVVALFASLLPAIEPIPLPVGDVWLDPTLVVHIGSGAVDVNRRLDLSTTIPPWLSIGEVLVYQAVSLSAAQTFEISPPGVAVVR